MNIIKSIKNKLGYKTKKDLVEEIFFLQVEIKSLKHELGVRNKVGFGQKVSAVIPIVYNFVSPKKYPTEAIESQFLHGLLEKIKPFIKIRHDDFFDFPDSFPQKKSTVVINVAVDNKG